MRGALSLISHLFLLGVHQSPADQLISVQTVCQVVLSLNTTENAVMFPCLRFSFISVPYFNFWPSD